MTKLDAHPKDCVWFYSDGWRYGEVIKKYNEDIITVKDCTGSRRRIQKMRNGKWKALTSLEFKEEKKLRKKVKPVKSEKKFKLTIKRNYFG